MVLLAVFLAGCEEGEQSPVSELEGKRFLDAYRREGTDEAIAHKEPPAESQDSVESSPREGELRWREFKKIASDSSLTELQRDALLLGQRVKWAGVLQEATTSGGFVHMRLGMPMGGLVKVALLENQTLTAVRRNKGEALAFSGRLTSYNGVPYKAAIGDAVITKIEGPDGEGGNRFWEGSTFQQMRMLGSTITFTGSMPLVIEVPSNKQKELTIVVSSGETAKIPLTNPQAWNLNGLGRDHTVKVQARIVELYPVIKYDQIHIVDIDPPLDERKQGLPPGLERISPLVPMRKWTGKDGRTMFAELRELTKGVDGVLKGLFVKKDRQQFTMSFDRLCDDDVDVIREAVRRNNEVMNESDQ